MRRTCLKYSAVRYSFKFVYIMFKRAPFASLPSKETHCVSLDEPVTFSVSGTYSYHGVLKGSIPALNTLIVRTNFMELSPS
jgi:hypothetical protein